MAESVAAPKAAPGDADSMGYFATATGPALVDTRGRQAAILAWMLHRRGHRAVATLTVFSMLMSTAICWPFFILLEIEPATLHLMLALSAAVPLVVAPLSLIPLLTVTAQLNEARAELDRLASTDALTGATSRAAFFELAATEWARAVRHNLPLSVLLLDVDHFKRINDGYGHALGDLALAAVAGAVSASLRQTDTLGRYGGEEFIALLPMTNAEGARVLAQRILEQVRRLEISSGDAQRVSVTISIGVATLGAGVAELHGLVGLADQALYAAKSAGRDRFEEHEAPA